DGGQELILPGWSVFDELGRVVILYGIVCFLVDLKVTTRAFDRPDRPERIGHLFSGNIAIDVLDGLLDHGHGIVLGDRNDRRNSIVLIGPCLGKFLIGIVIQVRIVHAYRDRPFAGAA